MVEAQRSTFRLSVDVQKSSILTGNTIGSTLYCVALTNGTVPISVGAMKSASSDSDGYLLRGASTSIPLQESAAAVVPLEINGLDAVELYAIFCYIETALGAGSSLDTVIGTRVTATTACCKLVTFTNVPLTVYADVLRYNKSNPSLFVFTYKLPVTLKSALQVIPHAAINGAKSIAVASIPSSSSFSSTTPVTGQFILSSNSITTITDCRVFLEFTGEEARQFASENATVRILPPSDVTPAPLLLNAQFYDSGLAVLMTFNSPTDSAGIVNATWVCSTVFTFSNAFDGVCAWQTASIVRIAVTNSSDIISNLLSIGDTVRLKDGKVRALCSGTVLSCALDPYSSASTEILGPKKPIAPTVVILAPPSIGFCSNLKLDATASSGSAARPFKSLIWIVKSLSDVDKSASEIEKYLNSVTVTRGIYQPIEISRSLLITATYTFTLRLTNYFNVTQSASIRVDVSDDRSAPSITILGPPYRSVTTASPFKLPAIAALPTCISPSAASYTWTVKDEQNPSTLQSTGTDPTVFSLPAFTLKINSTYTFNVQVTVGRTTASASSTIYVTRGEIEAIITGGYTREVAFAKVLDLSASTSRDLDVPTTSTSTLNFQVLKKFF